MLTTEKVLAIDSLVAEVRGVLLGFFRRHADDEFDVSGDLKGLARSAQLADERWPSQDPPGDGQNGHEHAVRWPPWLSVLFCAINSCRQSAPSPEGRRIIPIAGLFDGR